MTFSSLNRAESAPVPHHAAASSPTAMDRLALLVMLSGTFMVVTDFFIVNVALPAIQRELHASAGALQFVVAGYGLANATGLITGGRLGDMLGRRRMFMLGLLLFALASAACGLAPSAPALVAARVAQGLAGALLQPQVLAMLSLTYTGPARARAFAAYGLTLGLAALLGQLVGGALIRADPGGLGWRACFLINVPVAIIALLLAPRVLRASPPTSGSKPDVPGMALLAAALGALVWPLVEGRQQGWPPTTLLALAMAPVLLAMFAWHQRRLHARGGQPLVSPALFAAPGFARGLAVTVAFYAGNASFYFVLALYLQDGLGLSPLQGGGAFTMLALGFFATSLAAPRIAARLGRSSIAYGAMLLAAGHWLQLANTLLPWQAQGPGLMTVMLILLVVQGAGIGMVMAPLASAVLAGTAQHHAGVAAGVLATVQQVGNSVGVALVGNLFYARLESAGTAHGYDSAFAWCLGCLLGLALLVTHLCHGRRLAAAL
ncbi:MFS transporter [Cupriavidus basilensis]|uniref:Transmembrane efflux protein n=1 Tax=Cupriavidus basilensis TaxID=68895 RepID=A0A0C4YLG8_9BURK|nr:MFS transporter [Cupriavidus basilensis]AJG22864.1 Transmembrane efflux protein [Cupriavidus basilensis]